MLRPKSRVQTCCQVHAPWYSVRAPCLLDSTTWPGGKSLGGLCPGRKPPSHSEGGGGTLWKAGTCLQLERSRDTGTAGTCDLQRLTRSQSNLTQDSDRGMCPSTDGWTDRQKNRGRPHSTDTGSRSACAEWRRRTPAPPAPPRLGGQRSLARRAGPLTSRSAAEAVPQIAGQERSGRHVSQQTNGPASSLTRAGGAVVCLGGVGVQALPALPAPSLSRQAQLDLWALGCARLPTAASSRLYSCPLLTAPLAPPRVPDAQSPTRPRWSSRLPERGGSLRPGRRQPGSGGRWGSHRPVKGDVRRRRHSRRVRALEPRSRQQCVPRAPGLGSPTGRY